MSNVLTNNIYVISTLIVHVWAIRSVWRVSTRGNWKSQPSFITILWKTCATHSHTSTHKQYRWTLENRTKPPNCSDQNPKRMKRIYSLHKSVLRWTSCKLFFPTLVELFLLTGIFFYGSEMLIPYFKVNWHFWLMLSLHHWSNSSFCSIKLIQIR